MVSALLEQGDYERSVRGYGNYTANTRPTGHLSRLEFVNDMFERTQPADQELPRGRIDNQKY